MRGLAIAVLAALLAAPTLSPALAQVSPADDLTAVIALHGQPCGRVTSVQKRGDNNYLARCSGGQKYRVYVDPQGRTRVDKG